MTLPVAALPAVLGGGGRGRELEGVHIPPAENSGDEMISEKSEHTWDHSPPSPSVSTFAQAILSLKLNFYILCYYAG